MISHKPLYALEFKLQHEVDFVCYFFVCANNARLRLVSSGQKYILLLFILYQQIIPGFSLLQYNTQHLSVQMYFTKAWGSQQLNLTS